ncbi:hypothetical protein ACHAW5_010096 [Stephanodiscus triporus]|uniref:RING-type domain-containing protein n=1 Tax=Stephanodiscus triporus TaxID=2934178 RepID=A0ABD3QAU9_9STRA
MQLAQLSADIRDGHDSVGTIEILRTTRTLALATSLAAGTIWGLMALARRQTRNGTTGGVARSPSGTAADPVVIDDDDGGDVGDGDGVRAHASAATGSNPSLFSPALALTLITAYVPLIIASPLLWNAMREGLAGRGDGDGARGGGTTTFADSGFVHLVVLAMIAHAAMTIAGYRVLRDVLGSGIAGVYPGNRRGGGRRGRGRKLTVTEIADIVRKVPVEEYVSEENIRTGDCSVARMKRMMTNRGAADGVAAKCVERDDLVREIEGIRNFNEECAICAEEYVEGDILRVPLCRHEFHLHCFDKWMYTFSTDSRPATYPTCPLCKATVS